MKIINYFLVVLAIASCHLRGGEALAVEERRVTLGRQLIDAAESGNLEKVQELLHKLN